MLVAELWAIWRGLNPAWKKGYRNVIIESDSWEAINAVEEKCDLDPDHNVFGNIAELMMRDWIREANGCTDALAKDWVSRIRCAANLLCASRSGSTKMLVGVVTSRLRLSHG